MHNQINAITNGFVFALLSVPYAVLWIIQCLFLLQERQADVGLKEWVELIARAGLPIVGLLGIVWFLYKAVWPFIMKQVEQAQQSAQLARSEESNKIVDALGKMGQAIDRMGVAHLEANKAMMTEMQAMRQEIIRRNNH